MHMYADCPWAASSGSISGATIPRSCSRWSSPIFASLDKSVYRAATAELWGVDMREVAGSVTVPTLVLVGEHDSIAPPHLSRELSGVIHGAQLVVIPDAGHLPNEENPAAFNQAVRTFLEESERRMYGTHGSP